MKTFAMALSVALLASAAAGDDQVTVIRGHEFSSEELTSWYDRMAESYVAHGLDMVPVAEWEPALELISGSIFQVADDRRVLLSITGQDTIVSLIVPTSTARVAEGDRVKCFGIRAGAFRYLGVDGAERQVAEYHHKQLMTYSQFVDYLHRRGWLPEMAAAFDAEDAAKRATATDKQREAKAALRNRSRLGVWDGVGSNSRRVR